MQAPRGDLWLRKKVKAPSGLRIVREIRMGRLLAHCAHSARNPGRGRPGLHGHGYTGYAFTIFLLLGSQTATHLLKYE